MPHRRTYETDAIRVHWDSSRCIHTAVCLQTLPSVFDIRARPWVDLGGADAGTVAEAVEGCPTGALRYERLDGAPGEEPLRPTVVLPIDDGPLLVMGDLDVRTPAGEQITREARLTLCRCGLSRNQPFCDNSHVRRGWTSDPPKPPYRPLPPPRDGATDGPTRVVPLQDASLELRGHVRIHRADGTLLAEGGRAVLCRCGRSRTKPFCDGSHDDAGFRSATPVPERDRLEAETPAAFTPNPRVPDAREVADET